MTKTAALLTLLALLAPSSGCVVLEASADSSAPLLVVGGPSDAVEGWPGVETVASFEVSPDQLAGGAVVEVVAYLDWQELPHPDGGSGVAFVVRSPDFGICRTELRFVGSGGQGATWRASAELVVPASPEDPAAVPVVASCRSTSSAGPGLRSLLEHDAGGSWRGSLQEFMDTTAPITVELAIGDVQGGGSVRVVRWYARTVEPW